MNEGTVIPHPVLKNKLGFGTSTLPFEFTVLSGNQFKIQFQNPAPTNAGDNYLQMHLGVLLQTLKFSLRTKGQDLLIDETNPKEKVVSISPFTPEQSMQFPEFSEEALQRHFVYQGPYNPNANEAWRMYNKIFESISVSPQSKLILDAHSRNAFRDYYCQSGYATLRGQYLHYPNLKKFSEWIGKKTWAYRETKNLNRCLGLWVVHGPAATPPYDKGRLLITEWYRMTQRNLFGAPLFPLFEKPLVPDSIKELFHLEHEEEIINVFYTGPLPRKSKISLQNQSH